ncbi:MAG: hypothetical protein LUE99_05655 [Bacteroides sp.]|nr:hypothetical protein [Bacteroides sp.]
MKKLLPLFLIPYFLISCGGKEKVSVAEETEVKSDSSAIGVAMYRKGISCADRSSGMDSVLFYMQQAESYLNKGEDKAHVNRALAHIYAKSGELDNAIEYYLKASNTADDWLYGTICQEVMEACVTVGDYRKGLSALDAIRENVNSRKVVPFYHLAKGNLWIGVNQYDSAATYYRVAATSLNPWVAGEASRRLKLIYLSQGKDSCAFYAALSAEKSLTDELMREGSVKSR